MEEKGKEEKPNEKEQSVRGGAKRIRRMNLGVSGRKNGKMKGYGSCIWQCHLLNADISTCTHNVPRNCQESSICLVWR